MKKIRILSLALALLMTLAVFVSCKDNGEGETPPENPVTTIEMVKDSVTDYVIVYDYKASDKVVSIVKTLAEQFEIFLGAKIETRLCYSDLENEENDIEVEKEILVGVTNRTESIEALKGLRSSDYVIGTYGSKMVVGGSNDDATEKAVALFLTDYVYDQGDKYAVAAGSTMNFTFSSDKNIKHIATTYSYSKCVIMDARIDSYSLIYAASSDAASDCKALADQMQAHISKEAGYKLDVLKDTTYWADYQILIGDTLYTDDDLAKSLEDDDYYISLTKVEVTYEDGSKHDGAVIQILFGKNAKDAAFAAFKANFIKVSTTPLELIMNEIKVFTNMT